MIFSESNAKIAAAMAKAWAELENPKHNTNVKVKMKNGGTYTFDYTDLGGIFDEAKRVYKENGLTIIQNAFTSVVDGKSLVSVETMILHSSGEYVKSEPLQMIANPSIQDMGGQITYMKRYSLSAMLGIATEKDDDANGASGNDYSMNKKQSTYNKNAGNKQNTGEQPITSSTIGSIKTKWLEKKLDPKLLDAQIKKVYKKSTLTQLTEKEAIEFLQKLEQKESA